MTRFWISLDKAIAALSYPADTKYLKYVRIESRLLSEFWGRKARMTHPTCLLAEHEHGKRKMRMAVRLFLSSGGQRTVDDADSARLDGPFFMVSRWCPDLDLEQKPS